MHSSKLKQITVALCMVLVPISVFAAGLGKLNVMSGLGEPLKADIELISVTPEELSSITAAIASEAAYATQGIEKPASHNTIKVEIAKNAAGIPILKLNSAQPISEPFLDMLIQVDWSSGRLLREYTVLLDPPGYTGEVDANVQNSQTAQAPMVKSFSKNKKEPMADASMSDDGMASSPTKSGKRTKKAKPIVETESVVESSTDTTGQEYTTHRGDTLAKIAQDMKPEGISLEQMLVGLYQANPNAFQGGNMNRLKVGQIIRQPSEADLSAISRKEAVSEIKVQTTNWNAYRNKLAGIVADAAPSDSEASMQSAGGKINSTAEDKSMPAAAGPKDVVKLSAGDIATNKVNDETTKSLQAKIAALQEEAVAREKSVKEAESRTADLEKQIADMQKLLALKNGAMSDIQKQAEAQAAAEMAKPVEVTKPVEAAKPAEPEPVKIEPEAAKPAEPKADKPKPVIKPVEVAPVEEPSFVSGLMSGLDLGLLAPAAGLLALLGGGWLYLRKKRERGLADFEQGIMTSGGLKANTVFGNTASANVDTGDTSFLTDFSQSANGGMIDANDVDPIAEAEVYMAYGRDAQAEEILKDAISKEPKRYELHLKLLEMYAASKNLSAFETIAGELYTSLGAEDPTWSKVADIGIKLEPNNPLYQANSSPAGMGNQLDVSDFSNTPLAAEKDLDFSFDNDALVQNFAAENSTNVDMAAAAIDSFDLPQFDMNANEDMTNSMTPDVVVDSAEQAGSNTLDFDMGDFGDFSSKAADATADDLAVTENANDVSFGNTMPALDLPAFDAPKFMPTGLAEVSELAADSVLDTGVGDTSLIDISGTAAEKLDELPSFDDLNVDSFEFLQADMPQTEPVLDISGMESELATADFSNESDFNFDVKTITPEASSYVDDDKLEANPFDLTTIDLELNNNQETAAVELISDTELDISGNEPIEVETKLDLVAAYIEMDDKEGAKELLDEVMKEGGAGQRKRAEVLLAKIA